MTTQAINASLYKKLPYDTVKDFTPITLIAASPLLLLVHPSLPVKSVKELIALAKSKPGQLTFASSGNGTILHLSAETLKSMAGVDMIHVPYKGSSQAVTDLLAGRTPVMFSPASTVLAHIQNGSLKALAVTSGKRLAVPFQYRPLKVTCRRPASLQARPLSPLPTRVVLPCLVK